MNTTCKLGSFPFNWEEARKSGKFLKVNAENALQMVSGQSTPVLLRFVASSDVAHMGVMTLPAGGAGPRQTEYDSHEGDAVFYVRDGALTFLIRDTEETFEVPANEYMFIPEKTEYKCINYTGEVVNAVFMVAPRL